MKTTRFVLGALLVGGLVVLEGCGTGTYRIPNVAPVVKPKPEDDLLSDISGDDDSSSGSSSTEAPKAEPKADEKKPDEKKPDEKKPDAEKADEKANKK